MSPSTRAANGYTPAPVLELIDLRKAHGRVLALDGVSLRVDAGEIVGLLGPNGAGKSTLVAIASGLLEQDAGEVRLDGGSPRVPEVRRSLGIAPQSLAIYPELSADENLRFFAGLQGCAPAAIAERVDWALEFVGLRERRADRVQTYSGGMARRLNLAAALVHDPAVLLLDEPTVGVDPQSRNLLLDNVERLRDDGKAVLYTTHYMEEAERICDRVAIIDHGKILAEDRTAALLSAHAGKPRLRVEFDDDDVRSLETDDPLATLEQLARERTPRSFAMERPTLEQVFLQLTGRSLRE